MKKIKKITSIISAIILIALFVFVAFMQIYPDETSKIIGFRFYTVLSDSMEPKIPTYSLVFSRMIDEDEKIEPDEIVTFKADRFGEEILLTHYFKETQMGNDGNLYYRTQGATATEYDNFETSRSDIIGAYVFHVPFLGKIILFLKSKFGWLLYGELFVIYLINRTILVKMDEKEEEKKQKETENKIDENKIEEKKEIETALCEVTNAPIENTSSYHLDYHLIAQYGQTLKEIALPNADLIWANPDEKLKTGCHAYCATYLPRHAQSDKDTSVVNVLVDTKKATPLFYVPSKIIAEYGKLLSNIQLPNHFQWQNEKMIVKAGTHLYRAVFTPEDSVNYQQVEVEICVEVVLRIKVDTLFYKQNSAKDINVECTVLVNGLSAVSIDKTYLPKQYYDIAKDQKSLIIKAEYINTLSIGSHLLTIHFGESEATAQFDIEADIVHSINNTTEGKTNELKKNKTHKLYVMALITTMGVTMVAKLRQQYKHNK